MALTAPLWKASRRLQSAANNAPAMHANDLDAAAVKLLQQALVDTGFLHIAKPTGFYGAQTVAAVRDVEGTFNLDTDSGIAGRQVLSTLDLLLQGKRPATGGRSGSSLAKEDKPFTLQKVNVAITAAVELRQALSAQANSSTRLPEPANAAIQIHFKLVPSAATPNVAFERNINVPDLDFIINTYKKIRNVMFNSDAMFVSGTPRTGIGNPAEAVENGPITFGPAYADFDNRIGKRIGPNSRAAVMIHESTHVVDKVSGARENHISEFWTQYKTQPVANALHNPSSYAAFAAHVFLGREPRPRFGLGEGRSL